MSKLYKAICEAPRKYGEMRAAMNQRGMTVSYCFRGEMYDLVHIKKDNNYIVVKGAAQGPPQLLYTGPSVIVGPENISATETGVQYFMPIGTVQGLYYYDGMWRLCNSNAYDCTNLQWISELPLIDIVRAGLELDALDQAVAYTILISTHHNNIFLTPSDDKIYILGAVFTDKERAFQPAPVTSHKLIPLDKEDVPNTLLTHSTVKNFIADPQPTPSPRYVYGILSQAADGSYTIHFSQLGSTIVKITNNGDIKTKNIPRPDRYMYLLLKTIMGFENQEVLLRKHTKRHDHILTKINEFIDEKAKKIGNLPTNYRDSIIEDDFMEIFRQKYREVVNPHMSTEIKTVRDLLLSDDFIALYLKEMSRLQERILWVLLWF
jgi:hypothetical protein